MILSRQERERLVLDLYNQGKNTREMAEEVKISFKDIGAILKKAQLEKEAGEQQGQKMSQAAQAYKLFSDGESPVDVAIALNLRQTEVTEFYKEYWILKHQYDLSQIYEEIKDDIGSFVKLYRLSKTAGMNAQHIVKFLAIANNHLPSVESRYKNLKREVYSLEGDKRNSTIILQELSDHISTTRNTLEQYELSCKERRLEMYNLNREYIELEQLVNHFKNNNEEYVKFTKTVEEKVFGVLSNAKVLIRNALLSITESMRNNPERYRSIFYNISSITDYSGNGQDYMYGTTATKLITGL